jgi:hypothetical protein
VIQPGRTGAGSERVAKQQAAAAADLEHVVRGAERERVQDRPAGEVVGVLGAVHLPSPRSAGPARNPVGQPAVERIRGQTAVLPRGEILRAQPERAERLREPIPIRVAHSRQA